MHVVAERRAIVSPPGALRRLEVREEDGLLYVEACPGCGRAIYQPFVPPAFQAYQIAHTHRRHRDNRPCRLRLVVHPAGVIDGEEVEDGTSYERALLGGA